MGKTWNEKVVELLQIQTVIVCICMVFIPAATSHGDESDYPSYGFLSNIASDELSEQIIKKVVGELEKDRLAIQFDNQRQTSIQTLAGRMVSKRRFEAKLDDFKKLVDNAEMPPLDIFPRRYQSSDGLFSSGRNYVDRMMTDIVINYWLRQSGISHLELNLWDTLLQENSKFYPDSRRFLLSNAKKTAGKVLTEVYRKPYILIDQLAEKYPFKIQTNESGENVLQEAVRTVLKEAGLIPSVELIIHARIKLQLQMQKALKRNASDESTQRIKLMNEWRYPCDWDDMARDNLRLAAALLYKSSVPVESLSEANLGSSLLFITGMPTTRKSELKESLGQESSLLRAEILVNDLFRNNKSLNQKIEDLSSKLAQPNRFLGDIGSDSISKWVTPVVDDLESEIKRMIRNNRNVSESNFEILQEEAMFVLAQKLESIWNEIVTREIRTRQTRIVKLNAADLGDIQKFESFSGWPLREQVRITLEDSLEGEGWKKECLDNYFLSLSLDDRVLQLVDIVTRIRGH